MTQDLLDDWGVVDQGDQAQAPVAASEHPPSRDFSPVRPGSGKDLSIRQALLDFLSQPVTTPTRYGLKIEPMCVVVARYAFLTAATTARWQTPDGKQKAQGTAKVDMSAPVSIPKVSLRLGFAHPRHRRLRTKSDPMAASIWA